MDGQRLDSYPDSYRFTDSTPVVVPFGDARALLLEAAELRVWRDALESRFDR